MQEEFGADIRAIDPPAMLVDAGDKIMNLIKPKPVYARVDLVRDQDDRFLLMELELIEPSMYLRTNKNAPRRFAEAFDRHFRTLSGS